MKASKWRYSRLVLRKYVEATTECCSHARWPSFCERMARFKWTHSLAVVHAMKSPFRIRFFHPVLLLLVMLYDRECFKDEDWHEYVASDETGSLD